MKILFLAGGFPSKGNPSKGIFNLKAVKQLSKHTKELTVVHYRMLRPGRKLVEIEKKEGFIQINLSVFQIPIFNKYTICINSFLLALFLKKYIKDHDIIHSVSGFTGLSVSRLKKIKTKKYICQIIGDDINYVLPELKKMGCTHSLKKLDKFVCNSNSLKEKLINIFPETKEAVVLYRGVDLGLYAGLKRDFKDELNFLFLGGLVDYKHSVYRDDLKGGKTLMKAWSIVDANLKKDDKINLSFGGPNTHDSEVLTSWKKQLKHPGKVKVIGEILPQNIIKVYASSQVTIIPSMIEGFPNVGMESFAAGNMVIGSNTGGIPELIDDQKNGYLFEKSDHEKLASLIINVIDNKSMVNTFGVKAKEKAIAKFDDNNYGSSLVRLYKS